MTRFAISKVLGVGKGRDGDRDEVAKAFTPTKTIC